MESQQFNQLPRESKDGVLALFVKTVFQDKARADDAMKHIRECDICFAVFVDKFLEFVENRSGGASN